MGPEPVAIVEHPSGVNINFILNTSADASPTNILMDAAVKHTGFTQARTLNVGLLISRGTERAPLAR